MEQSDELTPGVRLGVVGYRSRGRDGIGSQEWGRSPWRAVRGHVTGGPGLASKVPPAREPSRASYSRISTLHIQSSHQPCCKLGGEALRPDSAVKMLDSRHGHELGSHTELFPDHAPLSLQNASNWQDHVSHRYALSHLLRSKARPGRQPDARKRT